jgi:N-acetylated-alpha-linked acidic dipeptidase
VFGGVDPSSGSATLMELVRSLGVLARDGLRPKRTIVFASWDAEEFTLTSSTEWGEQFADALTRSAVAYVNVDSSASGRRFTASAVPSLNRVIAEVARDIRDPATGKSIAEATQLAAASTERGSLPNATGSELVNNRLGSGSDYTVFLNYLGVPIVDMSFDGPYGVYHSMYDDHRWISTIGDPGFRYHTAMTRIWGVLALRLANADVLPFDYPSYAARLREFALELDKRSAAAFRRDGDAARPLAPVLAAVDRFAEAARDVDARQAKGAAASMAERGELNRILMQAERGFIDPQGIPGRPWYRHQIYAPKFTYAPEIFPGVAEALAAGDEERLREQSERVATAIDRVTRILRGR